MIQERATRVRPKEFRDFSVTLQTEESLFTGLLGNISETGLCAILATNSDLKIDDDFEVSVQHWPTGDDIEMLGRVAWRKEIVFDDRPHVMLGMEFRKRVELPEYLIALTYSEE
jgi:hypothetical protein